MCGIFGAINLNSKFNSEDYKKFTELTDLVRYRGPDSEGYISLNTHNNDFSRSNFNVFLGHRRLSIIDLSDDGSQPMQIDNILIVFNGEIFNYIELRKELIELGESFKTRSDTEVIIKLYKRFGESSFSRLNGMWAFIIVDLNTNRVIVSRDRFSIKPLYYTREGSKIFFASEIKQLLPLAKRKELNNSVMLSFLQQGLLDFNNETFFQNIFKVNAKCNVKINMGNSDINEEKYWDYETLEYSKNEEDIFIEFNNILTDSIRVRLRSDVEVGTLLSGGLDSSVIALISKELSNNNHSTFSVISDSAEHSEEKYIDVLVSEKKVKNEKFVIRTDELISNIDDVIYHQDEPFNNFIVIAHYNLLKKIKEKTNIKVILNGQGGDEALMGYVRYYYFYWKRLLSQGKFLRLSRELLFSLTNRTGISQFKLNAAKRYIPSILNNEKKYLLIRKELINVWNMNEVKSLQKNDIDKFSVPILTRYEDRNSMAFSQEIRLPFLDHRLVNFLIALPEKYKMRDGWSKYILRKSQQNLPEKIKWRRDKKGFILPEDRWLKKDFSDEITSYFDKGKSSLSQFGFIDDHLFLDYFNSFKNGNNKIHNTDITRIFIAEKWLKQYFAT